MEMGTCWLVFMKEVKTCCRLEVQEGATVC